MLKGKPKIEMPDDLDYEIAKLIDLINNVEGIETLESCFGHNKAPINIYCIADSIEDLHKFMYKYFYCDKLWHFELLLDDFMIDEKDWGKVVFLLKSDDKYIDFPTTQLMADNLTKRFQMYQRSEEK